MIAPKLLDVCCCEGAASEGYRRAGYVVYGIDLFEKFSQKRYPFASHKGDAILALCRLLAGEAIPFTHNGERRMTDPSPRKWHGTFDDFWYSQEMAMDVAADKALQTGIRQRVVPVDPYANPYAATWQIVPVDTPPAVTA